MYNSPATIDVIQFEVFKLIGNIMMGSDDQAMQLIDQGILPFLKTGINHHETLIRKEIAWIISNMFSGGVIVMKRLIKEGFIPLLLNQYNNETEKKIKEEIIISFANLSRLKEEENLNELYSLGVIDVICQTIELGVGDNDQNKISIVYCIESIIALFTQSTQNNKGGDLKLIDKFLEYDLVSKINDFRTDSNNHLKNKSQYFINLYNSYLSKKTSVDKMKLT